MATPPRGRAASSTALRSWPTARGVSGGLDLEHEGESVLGVVSPCNTLRSLESLISGEWCALSPLASQSRMRPPTTEVNMKALLIAIAVVSVVSFACSTSSDSSGEATASPTARSEARLVSATATPAAATSCPSPTACPQCPEPTACPASPTCPTCPECPTCPTCPTCPEPVVCPPALGCPQDTPCPSCPAPQDCEVYDLTGTPCPQCPDPYAALAAYLIAEGCAGAELNVELGELTGVDASEAKQFFNANCQGVALAKGSWLTSACAGAGIVSSTISASPEVQNAAKQAAMLAERYCQP